MSRIGNDNGSRGRMTLAWRVVLRQRSADLKRCLERYCDECNG